MPVVNDYLTDGKRLYHVERIASNGTYTLENCETEFNCEVDMFFLKSMKVVA